MFTIKNTLLMAESLGQAYEVLTKTKTNVILGGCMWLRQGHKNIGIAIDLSALGLDGIARNDDEIEIGCMATLRDLERSPLLTGGLQILPRSVASIVGTQFRNTATVGGSVYSRFGFSDLLTALLALDSHVHLFKGGVVSMSEYVHQPMTRDIVVKISVKMHENCFSSYQCFRLSASDFPVLALAVAKTNEAWKIAVGARPGRAALAVRAAADLDDKPSVQQIEKAAGLLCEELEFGSNMRGTEEYRRHIARVLFRRAADEILGVPS